MADAADRADVEQEFHTAAVDQARRLREARPVVHSLTCEECDEPIPLARRQALAGRDCVMCIDCQGLHERREQR